MRLPDFCAAQEIPFDREAMDDIFRRTRDAAYRIIERKGATYYAVAAGLLRIVEAILRDQRTVLSVSSLVAGYYGLKDVCLSLPTVVRRHGVERMLRLALDPDESAALRRSSGVLETTIAQIEDVLT